MLIIWRACDGFEDASGFIGRNLSDGVRGATINAIGSSLPELLATSIALLIYANKEGFAFGIGTTAGSAVFNSAVIPGLVILMVVQFAKLAPVIMVSRKVILRDGLCLIGAEFLLIVLLSKGQVTWMHGLFLIFFYLFYIVVMFRTMGESESEEEFEEVDDNPSSGGFLGNFLKLDLTSAVIGNKERTTKNAWGLLAVATGVIAVACWILVESCYALGDSLGIRTYFVAVILASGATSVPDTILSIKDAKAGNYDDAVANALGSNIFDICICLGLPLFIYCLLTGDSINIGLADKGSVAELRVLLLVITIVLFLIFLGEKMGKLKGYIMLLIYAGFVLYIIGRATETPVANTIGFYLQKTLNIIGG